MKIPTLRVFILSLVTALAAPAAAQQISPVVRTFRPDPNWPREEVTQRPAGELVLVDAEIDDVEAFIRANRCVVGRWVFERKLGDDLYFGYLRYSNANDDSHGMRRQSGPYRVRVPKGVRVPEGTSYDLALQHPQWSDAIVLRAIPGTTLHELIAYNGEAAPGQPGPVRHTLPRSVANTTAPFWGSARYAYPAPAARSID